MQREVLGDPTDTPTLDIRFSLVWVGREVGGILLWQSGCPSGTVTWWRRPLSGRGFWKAGHAPSSRNGKGSGAQFQHPPAPSSSRVNAVANITGSRCGRALEERGGNEFLSCTRLWLSVLVPLLSCSISLLWTEGRVLGLVL